MTFLPFHRPSIGEDEIAEVCDTLRSGWLTTGPKVKRFEAAFGAYVGAEHALGVNSCTAGLHLALEAIGVGPGDRVLTSPYTFTASAEVIRYLGADPVFVDIEPTTMNLDPEKVAGALANEPTVKAILPIHMAGRACDMKAYTTLAASRGIRIVEDAAHALPTAVDGQKVGSIGDVTVFSFYVTKPLATGEGGMICTNDKALAERMSVMRLHGIDSDVFDRYTATRPSWYYEVVAPGFKYNMTDMAAALGIHQLQRQDQFQARRQQIAEQYQAAFTELPIQCPEPSPAGDQHAWHLYVIQLNPDIDRNRFIELMSECQVGTSVHFIPLHLQPYWRDRYDLRPEDFPCATAVYERAVSLPIYPAMTDEDVARVVSAVRSTLERL